MEKDYRLNQKTGNILHDERVWLKCDKCGKEWDTYYHVYKRKKLKNDYCRSCKNSLGICGVKGGHSKEVREKWKKNGVVKVSYIDKKCFYCNKNIQVYKSQVKDVNFCSIRCGKNYEYEQNYNHLYSSFNNKNINYISYLVGLIYGDGNIRKSGKKTLRISIYFNESETDMQNIASDVLNKLSVCYHKYMNKKSSIVFYVFTCPSSIAKEYGFYFYGKKFDNQPSPPNIISSNINFLIGLINSDGYVAKRKSGGCYIQITNTVLSIINSIKMCCEYNNLKYRLCEYQDKHHKTWKKRYDVFIPGLDQRNKIVKESNFLLKNIRYIK